MEKSKEQIEKEADEIQNKIEDIQEEEIQKDYKKHAPAFIWFLKISIILGIIWTIITIALENQYQINIIIIIAGGILLFALYKRKRWGFYYGLILYSMGAISSIINKTYFAIIFYIVFFVLLYMHKDYMNK